MKKPRKKKSPGFEFDQASIGLLREALARLEEGFSDLPAVPRPRGRSHSDTAMRTVLLEAATRLQDNYPYFHTDYAGQMLKPPHPVARLAYALAMWINPNNHALDGGRASSAMEKEAVAEIAGMFGWESFLGHLCGGGTIANLEALWVAGELAPGKAVVASEQAHYTHKRISGVLKLPFDSIPCDDAARMDLDALEDRLRRGGVGTVVATLGTTATGSVDPLPEILALRERFGFRLHADCAYGGYYVLSSKLSPPARAAFDRAGEADSIVIDPHKHGLQPYGCGCVLFRDPAVGRFYRHDSPYTYFSSEELHLGEISLECSRAGAAAVALWATQKLLPLQRGGEFAGMLDACRSAALALHAKLAEDPQWIAAFPPELDIVAWTARSEIGAASPSLAQQVFDAAAENGLHLALAQLPARFFGREASPADPARSITCLRSVLMRPGQAGRIREIHARLGRALAKAKAPAR